MFMSHQILHNFARLQNTAAALELINKSPHTEWRVFLVLVDCLRVWWDWKWSDKYLWIVFLSAHPPPRPHYHKHNHHPSVRLLIARSGVSGQRGSRGNEKYKGLLLPRASHDESQWERCGDAPCSTQTVEIWRRKHLWRTNLNINEALLCST